MLNFSLLDYLSAPHPTPLKELFLKTLAIACVMYIIYNCHEGDIGREGGGGGGRDISVKII